MTEERIHKSKIWFNNSFNIDIIDQFNNDFIDLLYAVEDIVCNKEKTSILPVINRLEEYCQKLKQEEELIIESGIQNNDHHFSQHRLFEVRTKQFKQQYNYNNPYLASSLLDFLKKWLISHIVKEDNKYRLKIYDYLNIKNKHTSNIWFSDKTLKINPIDTHHNRFLEILYDTEKATKENDKQTTASILTRLKDYISNDLSEEEELLKHSNYKDINHHISQHQILKTYAEKWEKEFNYNNPYLASNILQFLKKWLISHILVEDKKYRVKVYEYLNIKYHLTSNIWLGNTALKIKSIYKNHHIFLDILYDTEKTTKENNKQSISFILERLNSYISKELKEEEELLKLAGFKNIKHHISQHKLLKTYSENWEKELSYNNQFIATNILHVLKKWLISHILKEDEEYREFVFDYLQRYSA